MMVEEGFKKKVKLMRKKTKFEHKRNSKTQQEQERLVDIYLQ